MSIFLARPDHAGAGTRLAVKDLFDTAGMRATYGSRLFADHVPDRTAEAVARLEAAGYANAGKTNLHEFAYGVTSHNPHFGTVPNPLAAGRSAGGSSAGSGAALAAGLADAALGTDSAGSIRIPAACCGVVGFKPTHGLVPLDGCFPLAPSFDHAGPMARDVETCVHMLEALARGFEPAELGSLDELQVGVAWLELADPLVRSRVREAAGVFPRRRAVEFPLLGDIAAVFMREVAESHRGLFPEHSEDYGDNVRAKLKRCIRVTDAEYESGLRRLQEYRERAAEAMDGLDLLLTPTLAFVAPPAFDDDRELLEPMIRFTYPFNALGWPALALPCGEAGGGLPASVQLAARSGQDARVLAAGALLERSLGPPAPGGDRGSPGDELRSRSIVVSMTTEPASGLAAPQRRRRARHRLMWRAVNPVLRRLAGIAPWWVLVETRGRRTGLPRVTPLARGPLDGDVLWVNSVHGRHALWVRNLEATPEVRVKLSGRWRQGRATVHEYDEAIVRRFNAYARSGPATLGIEPVLVRIELRR